MSAARAVIFVIMLAIPAALWGFLNAAKNDVPAMTRSLIKQIDSASAGVDYSDMESVSRLGGVQANFFIRYRYPDGDPDRQEMLFGGLWRLLDDSDPKSVTRRDVAPTMKVGDKTHTRQRVRVTSLSREGTPVNLDLDWVQFRGSWYIQGYWVDGIAPDDGTLVGG